MTIIFDSTAKSTARHPFGSGILAWTPTYRADHTAEDERWWTEQQQGPGIDWDAEGEWVTACELIEAGYSYL